LVPRRARASHEWRCLAIREQDFGAACRARHAVMKSGAPVQLKGGVR
jgi:hypothetical protein